MREQFVVHLPEFDLSAGSFGGFGGTQRMRMSLHGREVTKDKTQIAREKTSNLLDCWISLPAMKAFKVAILNQRYGGGLGTSHVILICHCILESHNFRAHISSPFSLSRRAELGQKVLPSFRRFHRRTCLPISAFSSRMTQLPNDITR